MMNAVNPELESSLRAANAAYLAARERLNAARANLDAAIMDADDASASHHEIAAILNVSQQAVSKLIAARVRARRATTHTGDSTE